MASLVKIKLGACLLAALLAAPLTAAQAAPRIGVQLWSVKDDVKHDFEGTLTKLAALGFDGVEFAGQFGRFDNDAKALRAFLDRAGLKCAGAHVDFAALSAARRAATTAFYGRTGCKTLIIAMDRRAASGAGAAVVARELSFLSDKLAPLGMRIGYHNHAEEMTGADGKTPWDVIAAGTPFDVVLQQDVGWTTFAGKDPVALIKRYPGRSVSLHFKAKHAPGTKGVNILGRDPTDWAGVAQAAQRVGGAEWIIVEQEDYPNGMGQLESVAASMRGLQKALRPNRAR